MACDCNDDSNDFPSTLNLGSYVTGDEWEGREFLVEVRTSAVGVSPVTWGAPADELDDVVMQFHTSSTQRDNLEELDVTGTEITILDAATWSIRVEPVTFTSLACPADEVSRTYYWAMRFKPDGLGYKTYLQGSITFTPAGIV